MKHAIRGVRVVLATVALSVSGCSAAPPAAAPVGGCPATIDIQGWWSPQADNAYLYQGLLGDPSKPPTYTVDKARSRVTGPLYDAGRPTGLKVTIRAGGPILNYASTPSLMATDHTIFIGQMSTMEDQIAAYGQGGRQDTVAVFAPLETDPRAVMWDSARHPDVHTLADVGNRPMTVYSLLGAVSTLHLVATGVLREGQVDTSGGNSPHLFLTHRDAATTGYVTNELDLYRSKGVRVEFDMIANKFPTYSDALVVRSSDVAENTACLHRIIPILQRNERAFIGSPLPAVRLVSYLAARYTGEDYPISRGLSAVSTARTLGILADGPGHVLGATNPQRLTEVLHGVRNVLATQHLTLPADLTAARLATGEFLDNTVSLERK